MQTFDMFSEEAAKKLIQLLNTSPWKIVGVSTGAGLGFPGFLASVGGLSNTLREWRIPYGPDELERLLGYKPRHAVSLDTACDMAWSVSVNDPDVVSLAITGAIQTDRARRGRDHVHIALLEGRKIFSHCSVIFERATWKREAQDALVNILALNFLASALLRVPQVTIPFSTLPGKICTLEMLEVDDGSGFVLCHRRVWRQRIESLGDDSCNHRFDSDDLFYGNLRTTPDTNPDWISPQGVVLIPITGAPLTHGHLLMAERAAREVVRNPVFVLERQHPFKGAIEPDVMAARVRQFAGIAPVIVTENCGLYVEMAERFPGAVIAMGMDAFQRMITSAHDFGMTPAEQWSRFRNAGVKLLVFSRKGTQPMEKETVPGDVVQFNDPLIPDISSSWMRDTFTLHVWPV